MKVLVIGSEGNIGSVLVPYLKSKGHEVLRCDIIQQWADDYVQTDVVSLNDLFEPALRFMPDVVFHLAAMVSRVTCESAPHLAVDTNLSGTNNVIQLCKTLNAKLINFSTSEIYGNIGGVLHEEREDIAPNNRYGLTKYMAEMLVKYEVENHGLRAVSVRPFMFYHEDETRGDHRSAMIRFVEHLMKKETIEVHKGSKRAWLHLEDSVRALEKVMYVDEYMAINLGHPRVVETEYIAHYIADKLGVDYKKYVIENELPERMTLVKIPGLDRQKNILGFEPEVDLENGIDRVIQKLSKQIKQEEAMRSILL